MEYSSRFTQEVRRRLEDLRSAIGQDLDKLESVVPNLSFSQADEIMAGATSLVDSYRAFMKHFYRGPGKPVYGSGKPRFPGAGPRGKIEPAALETMQGQGYLMEKEFVAKYGFNRNAVSRKLQDLAAAYGWERERSDEGGWRYSPRTATATAERPTSLAEPPATRQPITPGESSEPSGEPPGPSEPATRTRRKEKRSRAPKKTEQP